MNRGGTNLKHFRAIGYSAAVLAVLFAGGCATRSGSGEVAEDVAPANNYVQPETEVLQPQLEPAFEEPDEPAIAEPVIVETPAPEEPVAVSPQIEADRGDILWIQERLKELGYYQGSIDGSVGGATRRAIEGYQTDQGIEIDGRPSAELREYMWRNGG